MSVSASKTLPRILRSMYKDLKRDSDNLAWTAIDGRFHRLLQAADEIERLQAELAAVKAGRDAE